MKTISILELRKELPRLIRSLQKSSDAFRVTYRGKPIAHLTPIRPRQSSPPKDDPFYHIGDMAVDGPSLTNAEIDETLYGRTDGVH